jgi:hypothetical protein
MTKHHVISLDTSDFGQFIHRLYEERLLPPVIVLDDVDDDREYFRRTGNLPVLREDETTQCPVFGDWGTYYAFMGWLAYRRLPREGNEFQSMANDLLNNATWTPEIVRHIGIINALAVVQNEYADKFGHYPADLNKFVTYCVTFGASTVLLEDIY